MQNVRSRNWCFTLNNYTEDDHVIIRNIEHKYLVVGKEVGESGTPHLQGYIVFQNAKTFGAVQKLFKRAHLEAMRGTPLEASTYCKKDGDFFEDGEHPLSATDKGEKGGKMELERWAKAKEQAYEGGDCEDPMISFLHYKACKNQLNKRLKDRVLEDTTDCMLWYWGESGTGKSRKARTDHPTAYLKMCNKWWDGYEDEDVVLIEDFDKEHACLAHHLKIWGDRYPFLCEHKGGANRIRPKLIIVTSNYHPKDIWVDDRDLQPILRRFDCVEFKSLLERDDTLSL